ncbi:hypothetical protein [Nitrosomonas communis]|uniref:Uncharacterized protein n=1 Tax=Nitrosomonas communis TaxID=44574 RepID=A0A1H2XST0_9PROT|nr:hypothetical protein [Nitrosomonas communis]SDW95379.1 hypothetical protein SAMN05421882_10422 [Nitrosomonas communis]
MSNTNQPAVGFVIINPLTGRPVKETPDGIALENKVFSTKEELEKFVDEHWKNPMFCAEIQE